MSDQLLLMLKTIGQVAIKEVLILLIRFRSVLYEIYLKLMLEKIGQIALKEVLILVIGFFVIKYLLKILKRAFDKSKRLDPMLHTFFINAFKIVFWTSLILIMLKTAGMDVTSFLAIFAAAGAAIALALKDSLGNFAGGILLMITRPFSKGGLR